MAVQARPAIAAPFAGLPALPLSSRVCYNPRSPTQSCDTLTAHALQGDSVKAQRLPGAHVLRGARSRSGEPTLTSTSSQRVSRR